MGDYTQIAEMPFFQFTYGLQRVGHSFRYPDTFSQSGSLKRIPLTPKNGILVDSQKDKFDLKPEFSFTLILYISIGLVEYSELCRPHLPYA